MFALNRDPACSSPCIMGVRSALKNAPGITAVFPET